MTPELGARDGRILRACCPANPGNWWAPGSVRDTVSKIKQTNKQIRRRHVIDVLQVSTLSHPPTPKMNVQYAGAPKKP